MTGEIELRSATVADVSYPKRTVTVIVAPYDTPTVIHSRRRSYTEIVTRGAYDGVQRRRNIRANRNHNWDKIVGRVTASYPDRAEGLVTDIKLFNTAHGNETLELCAEDGLSASAGFGLMRENEGRGPVKPDAEVWENRGTVRRLNHLWLDHVAFVPDPAYQDANVLDVRNRPDPDPEQGSLGMTPNLDRLQIATWRQQLALLDNRYGV